MTQEDYDTMKAYSLALPEMRKAWPDGQLLDWCQKVMGASVESMAEGPFDDAPPTDPEEPPPESLSQKLIAL